MNNPKVYRFDIFKGETDKDNRVRRTRSVGVAYYVDRTMIYTVYLNSLQRNTFYMRLRQRPMDFTIWTKRATRGKEYWYNVGHGAILEGQNAGFARLSWDLFGATDIYMNLHAKESYEQLVIKVLREEILKESYEK